MISFKRELSTCFNFLVNRFSELLAHLQQELAAKPCLLCLATTTNKYGICMPCEHDLPLNSTCCYRCALPLPDNTSHTKLACGECISSPPPFTQTLAPFNYLYPVKGCIQKLKYKGRRYFAPRLSYYLVKEIQNSYAQEELPEVLIPVPLHRKKKKQRGFNQSDSIASYLSKTLKIPVSRNSVRKTKDTDSQTNLSKTQRKQNLNKAFTLANDLEYKHVALIDDVMTTRATAEVIAKQLLGAGVDRVDVWCVARTPKPGQ